MTLRFGHIELFVADSQRSREFYESVLGFELVEVQGKCVWLKLDSVEILLRPGPTPQSAEDYGHAHTAIVLYTDDLPETCTQLEDRGLTFLGCDGSECCPTFTDLDRHWFQLVDPKNHP